MFRLHSTSSATAHVQAARFHVRACVRFPATSSVGDSMEPLIDELRSKVRALDDASQVETEALADVSLADDDCDDVIRDIKAAADIADRKDPTLGLTATLFPKGLTPVVSPINARQLRPTQEILAMVKDNAKVKHALGKQFLGPLEAAVQSLAKAIDAHEAAQQDVARASSAVDAAKAAIREQFEVSYGQLRALFKATPGRAERFFQPRKASRRRTPPTPEAPTASPTAPVASATH